MQSTAAMLKIMMLFFILLCINGLDDVGENGNCILRQYLLLADP